MSPEPDLMECADCLCLASRRAARAITRSFEKHLRPYGIRATQFSLLVNLELRGPLPIGELAEVLSADRTTLTRNLALIEEQGLVRIRPGDDARARVVTITPKGRAAIIRSFPAWRDAQSEMSKSMGQTAADSLRRLARSAQI
jgi:DNA-binding MarR family transcriptional regulator